MWACLVFIIMGMMWRWMGSLLWSKGPFHNVFLRQLWLMMRLVTVLSVCPAISLPLCHPLAADVWPIKGFEGHYECLTEGTHKVYSVLNSHEAIILFRTYLFQLAPCCCCMYFPVKHFEFTCKLPCHRNWAIFMLKLNKSSVFTSQAIRKAKPQFLTGLISVGEFRWF